MGTGFEIDVLILLRVVEEGLATGY